jgi:hypothetical protein
MSDKVDISGSLEVFGSIAGALILTEVDQRYPVDSGDSADLLPNNMKTQNYWEGKRHLELKLEFKPNAALTDI